MNRKQTNKKVVQGLSILIVLLIGVSVMTGCVANKKAKIKVLDVQAKEYLENKYDEDFVIKESDITLNEIGDKPYYGASAYPSDDPDIVFGLGKYAEKTDGTFIDGYISSALTKEKTKEIEKVLTKQFGFVPEYKFAVRVDSKYTDEFSGEILVYEEALEIKGVTSLYLDIEISGTYDDSTMLMHAKRVFEIFRHLNTMNTEVSLYYSIDISSQEDKYNTCMCRLDEKMVINSPEDVVPEFYKTDWREKNDK